MMPHAKFKFSSLSMILKKKKKECQRKLELQAAATLVEAWGPFHIPIFSTSLKNHFVVISIMLKKIYNIIC